MNFLKEYAHNIVVISVLSTIFEIIIPEGKNKKVTVLAVGLVVMLTVMSPLEKITKFKHDITFPSFSINESFPSYEKNIVADVFEENLSNSISEKTAQNLNKSISCTVKTSRNEEGEITEIKSVFISPYDEETAYFIEKEFSLDFNIIKGDNND
ncbi:MAG: hypothetical protein E7407_03600 [Ruminococcaceae bacterium]|nr:hypothetical protein [Oscillospiraceae bacterium]